MKVMKRYNDDEMLIKNILAGIEYQWSEYVFHDFYDPSQQKLISSALDKVGVDYSFFGGYIDSERKMLVVGSKDASVFPIEVLEFSLSDQISHRDILGAFLSTGIKREIIGDIVMGTDKAMVFVKDSFSWYLKDNIGKIKNKHLNIDVKSYSSIEVPKRKYEKQQCIASSLRLDNIISKICFLSRGESTQMIKKGMVKIDHVPVEKASYELKPGSIISIRGHGRFLFDRILGNTKKGNKKIQILKYM
jgi:RNA-binding protein YlmH